MQPPASGSGRYELREILGRGGMGVIYRAWDTLMRREVALKTIYDVSSQSAQQLFYREWGLQASITHPNIAEIYDIGEMEHDGEVRPYFVMPLLPGFTLDDLIAKSSPRLTVDRIAGMIIQICRGLQAAHDRGLIHRDLKPSNVFILEDDSVKIIDFGVAHAGTGAQTTVRGTLAYMAPELFQMKPASAASDIFAVGVLSYEALTHRRPFTGSTDTEISRAILYEHPASLVDLLPNLPINLGRAIHKALAKQPWHRYSSAKEFGDTVRKALHGEPIAIFDSDKVLPRVEKATRAFEKGEYQVAMEILHELESEGHVEQEITLLRRQVEQVQRQGHPTFIAETDLQVEQQPDLDKRTAILEEALLVHPGEPHFERALKLTQDKRDLVSSVVSRARLHEDEGRYGEAIDQWEILRAIHPVHPGLDLELERLRKRKDAQSRQDARGNWVKRIDAQMEARAYGRAASDVEQALVEFPGDAELEQIGSIARKKNQKLAEALQILEKGRSLIEEGHYGEGIETLRGADQLDEGNPTIRTALTAALAARAKKLAEEQSESADSALAELLQVDPANTLGMNLRALRADQKREEFITWCTAQARKLHAAGDLNGAIAIVQQGLLSYPKEARLNQLLGQLEKGAREVATKSERKQAIEQLQSLSEAAEKPSPVDVFDRISAEASAIEKVRSGDQECMALIGEIRNKIAKSKADLIATPPPPQPPPTPKTTKPEAAAPIPSAPAVAAAAPVSPKPAGPAASPRAIRPPRALPKPVRNAIIGGAILIVLVSVFALWKKTQVSGPGSVQVEIRTTPPGARIMVGGEQKGLSNLTLEMAPGEYQITAELDGYEPLVTPLTVQKGVPTGVGLMLNPWRPSVRVYSDIELASASLSGKPMNPGATGEYVLDSLNDGNYELALSGPQGSATVALQLAGNSMPAVTAPVSVTAVDLLLVHLFRDRLVVYTSTPAAQVSVDGGSPKPVPPEGASFSGIAPGTRQVEVNDGKTSRTVPVIVSGGAPVVQTFVLGKSDSGRGSILIATGEDQVVAKINGYAHWLKSRNGAVRIGSLKPGIYKVEVFKDGFQSPPPASVEVKAGEEARIELRPRVVVRLASVTVSGPSGAQVVVDGSAAGSIPASGSITLDLPPGQHSFELRRATNRSASVTRDLRAGESVSLASELAFPQQATGTVKFEINPPAARMTLRRRGEAENQAQAVTQSSMTLPEGSYVLTVSAQGYATSVVTFQVGAGSANTLPVALRQLAEQSGRAETAPPKGIQDFQDISSWTADGAWRVRRGGNYVLYGAPPAPGTYQFAFQLRRGKRAQWVVNYKDPRNHVLFRIEDKEIVRVEVVNGRQTETGHTAHKLANLNEFDVRIVVERNRIRHEFKQNGGWVAVDQMQSHADDLSAGRFGFIVPGNRLGLADEVAVKDFVFRPGGGGQ